MELDEKQSLVAPCGIPCGLCELYLAKDDPKLREYFLARGVPANRIPCPGCRASGGDCPVHPGPCATWECVQAKGHTFCHECEGFPCGKLHPAADRAEVLPHNLKVYNLCTIERRGLDRFLEEAAGNKARYYKGKMVIGSGPQLD